MFGLIYDWVDDNYVNEWYDTKEQVLAAYEDAVKYKQDAIKNEELYLYLAVTYTKEEIENNF